MKKLSAFVLTLALCFSLGACSKKEEPTIPENVVNPVNVTISIVDSSNDDLDAEGLEEVTDSDFIVEDGTNILDATQIFCVSHDMEISLDSSGKYVTSIMNIKEKDFKDTTGWIFKLNGESVAVGAKDQILKDGDHITWEFIDMETYQW